jgi:hypothetical protein
MMSEESKSECAADAKPTMAQSSEATFPPVLTKDQLRNLLIDFLDRLIASKPPAKAPE